LQLLVTTFAVAERRASTFWSAIGHIGITRVSQLRGGCGAGQGVVV